VLLTIVQVLCGGFFGGFLAGLPVFICLSEKGKGDHLATLVAAANRNFKGLIVH
jgi:hypothetical protein